MAQMIDSITVTRTKIFKGASRLMYAPEGTSFPGILEHIMNPAVPAAGAAYALDSDWTDLGPTTEDGVTIRRSTDLSDGIPVDQRQTNLDEGEPEKWTMELETALLHTDLDTFQIAWEGGNKRTVAGSGSNVAQHALDLDAPFTFTERLLAVAQEDPKSGGLRIFAFRSAIPQVDGSEVVVQSSEASSLPLKFKLNADTAVSEGDGQFGKIFEED